MRVLLIRPGFGALAEGFEFGASQMEPLGLMTLAALTPPGVQLSLLDERVNLVDLDTPADLAAISVETFDAARAYALADQLRARGVPVVLGGVHPSLVPEEAAEHADAVVLGDAETVWAGLLEDARCGRLAPRYDARGASSTPAHARRDLHAPSSYLPVRLSQFSRGCPNACAYCAPSVASGRRRRVRPPREVARELAEAQADAVFLVDDNLGADRAQALALAQELEPLRLRWASQTGIELADDPELLDAMLESGCVGHVIGFETLSADSLRGMGKTHNLERLDRYHRCAEALRARGLQTWAAFSVGHDGDTPQTLRELVDFAISSGFAMAAFNLLTPYPGTALYQRLAAEQRLLYDGRWWLHPDYRYGHAAFEPRHFGVDELGRACREAEERFYSLSSIARRLLDRSNHGRLDRLLLFLGYNGVYLRFLRASRQSV